GWRQPLTYRPAAEWSELLSSLGFATEALPMSQGTPFANTLFIARQSKVSVQICPSLHDSAGVSIPSTMKPQPTADTVQNS
ncbi:hypothetical protein VH569_21255, partial [Azospirillum sp. 11R-A]|uniref:hypothetical protein n=1 Tax=Azospirillum sp. 11R-A TaxID=3111634 RepID=UPI003C1B18EF